MSDTLNGAFNLNFFSSFKKNKIKINPGDKYYDNIRELFNQVETHKIGRVAFWIQITEKFPQINGNKLATIKAFVNKGIDTYEIKW